MGNRSLSTLRQHSQLGSTQTCWARHRQRSSLSGAVTKLEKGPGWDRARYLQSALLVPNIYMILILVVGTVDGSCEAAKKQSSQVTGLTIGARRSEGRLLAAEGILAVVCADINVVRVFVPSAVSGDLVR